jgi:tRNA(Ile)-lysidine synthase
MVNLNVVEQLLNHIRRYALCKTTDKILLAVSGGVDSMVMLHLLKDAGLKVGVAHCNFQLRGAESSADEELVRKTCDGLNVPFFVTRFDTTTHATTHKVSIQMAARDLRYAYFRGLLETEGYDLVATAHHFNDTIESTLLNLVRGTGMDGLVGIAPKKEKVIRPLLFANRAMIMDYALQEKIPWREDATNLSDDYQRNFIRHQVIPRLEEVNPGFEQTFRDTHDRLLGASLFAQSFIKEFRTLAVEKRDKKTNVAIRGILHSPSPAVLLWELIKELGFNFDQCRQMVNDHQPGKLFYSTSHQLLVDRTHFIIEKKQPSQFTTMTLSRGQQRIGEIPFALVMKEQTNNDFQLVKDPSVAQLDVDRLQFPLIWRKWQAGDYFIPLGMRQEKKLSDFLIDLKIPFNTKADITVLESAGEIVWVVGYRINERYKVTEDTKRILVIEEESDQERR